MANELQMRLDQDHNEELFILHNLRFWQKFWQRHFGPEARKWMDYWQQRADEHLDRNGLTAHNNQKKIQVFKDAD
jgi:hypothetical protein